MPQSLTKLYAHLIFSTKNRRPFLDDEIRTRVHACLATVVRDLGSPFVVVGVRLGLTVVRCREYGLRPNVQQHLDSWGVAPGIYDEFGLWPITTLLRRLA